MVRSSAIIQRTNLWSASALIQVSILIAFSLVFSTNTFAQANRPQVATDCFRGSGDAAIRACTEYLSTGKGESARNRAIAHTNRGFEYSLKNDFERAIRDYDAAIALDASLAFPHNHRGFAWMRRGRPDLAIRDFDEAIRLDASYVGALLNRGNTLRERGELQRALQDYDVAIRLDPSIASAYSNRGAVHFARGDLALAIRDYDEAIRLDPGYTRAHNNRGFALARAGDLRAAIAAYDEATRLDPHYVLAFVNRASARRRSDDLVGALADYDTALRLDSGSAANAVNRGTIHRELGNLQKALADFDLAVRLDPRLVSAYLSRAEAYRDKRDFDRAVADLDAAIRLAPTSAVAFNNRGRVRHDAGILDGAIRDYDAALVLDPGFIAARFNRGTAYRDRKDYARAIQDFDEVIRRDPTSAPAYNNRGVAHFASGSLQPALRDYDDAIRLFPSAPTYGNRGIVHAAMGNVDVAVTDFSEAIRLDPDFAAAFVNRGLISEAKGEKERAIEDYRAALARPRRSPDAVWAHARAQERLSELEASPRISMPSPTPTATPQAPVSVALGAPVVVPERPALGPETKKSASLGRRIALVIGNSAYRHVSPLSNARSDSEKIAAALRSLGFQQVQLEYDLGGTEMRDAIKRFTREADAADWAAVYFAGHGIEVGGTNYMIPVDARLESDRDVDLEAVSLNSLMAAVERTKKLRIVLLDACRNNPFLPRMHRSIGSRSVGRGLAPIEPDTGTLVVFAAKHGELAWDGEGENSPFATALLKRIGTPRLEVRRLFDIVRDDVMAATRRRQQPYTYGSVPGSEDYYFVAE